MRRSGPIRKMFLNRLSSGVRPQSGMAPPRDPHWWHGHDLVFTAADMIDRGTYGPPGGIRPDQQCREATEETDSDACNRTKRR